MRITHIVIAALAMTSVIPGTALAVDGVIEINQARALKGGVTPGDAAGFPVTISVSGSYRLTGNLTVDANTNAISVSADNVSIDLNGFAILGPVTCSGGPPVTSCTPVGTGIGIYGSNMISVSNGKIQGMGWNGVLLGARARLSELTVRWSGAGAGIQVGSAATITACNVSENGMGIQSGDGALISRNIVQGNLGIGVNSVGVATITGNTLRQNGQKGIQLMSSSLSGGSTVVGNSITRNTGLGLSCDTSGGTDGYAQNVLNGNNGGGAQVSGCTSLGTGSNLCNGAACP